MSSTILEFFGYAPLDKSPAAEAARHEFPCPFAGGRCTKRLNDGTVSGVCTIKQINGPSVIVCPNRLYAGNYQILLDAAVQAFGPDIELIAPRDVASVNHDGRKVVAFGQKWGKELKLPRVRGRGGFFVDWVLALISSAGTLQGFVAVEVQSMDTTGNYRAERDCYLRGTPAQRSTANPNWENVSKRILPQLIYKGHVLRRERLCTRGMFFVCPTPVYERIMDRLGGQLLEYSLQSGALTFRWYDVGPAVSPGKIRRLQGGEHFTTTVDQVLHAFNAPANLPPANVYEDAIRAELRREGLP